MSEQFTYRYCRTCCHYFKFVACPGEGIDSPWMVPHNDGDHRHPRTGKPALDVPPMYVTVPVARR